MLLTAGVNANASTLKIRDKNMMILAKECEESHAHQMKKLVSEAGTNTKSWKASQCNPINSEQEASKSEDTSWAVKGNEVRVTGLDKSAQ